MSAQPPKRALRFLRWFCKEDYLEEIEGDLIELFEQGQEESPSTARRYFWWQVIRHFRPDFIKSFQTFPEIYPDMLKNYFKIAWRNLLKHKLFSLVNLLGLTIGMACFILIALYIQYELSFDMHHQKADQIYRVVQQQKGNVFRGTDFFAVSSEPLAPALEQTFPEVKAAATVGLEPRLLSNQDQAVAAPVMFADERIFDIFDVSILKGNGPEVLANTNSILLSQSLAETFFGLENPIGQEILFANRLPLIVEGIFGDVAENQHFTYDCVLSIKNYPEYDESVGKWDWNNYRTYVLLSEGHDYKELEKKLSVFGEYVKPAYERFPFEAPTFFLQPIKRIHLHSNVNFETGVNSDIRYIYLFLSIAIIIILLAAINYMNLATARSVDRSKEVGVRKVLGAKKGQLVSQLLGESFLLTFVSFLLAVGLVFLWLPQFNHLLERPIKLILTDNIGLLIGMLLFAILIGGLSGLYPAVFLSSISPIKAFNGKFFKKLKGISTRNVLVVGQFAAAIVLAISSIVVYQQLNYMQNKSLGFNQDQIIYVPFFFPEIAQKTEVIRNELLKHQNIKKVSVAKNLPINTGDQGITDRWEGNEGDQSIYCYRNYVDYDFLDLFEMELVAGRNFSLEFPTDSTESFLLNESAAEAIGWTPESAIGKQFRRGRVIGVVKDFHFQPMDLSIEPQYIMLRAESNNSIDFGNVTMKVGMKDLDETLTFIKKIFAQIAPGLPANPTFMDESLDALYESEERLGLAFNIFTLLALLIASIGLFGLISYSVIQRRGEIGVRKVLGASVTNIIQLLSADFIKLVGVAIVLAIPIAWYIMKQWLQGFAYRVNLQWWIFLAAGFVALTIAFLTVGLQSFKAATANPIKSLQQE